MLIYLLNLKAYFESAVSSAYTSVVKILLTIIIIYINNKKKGTKYCPLWYTSFYIVFIRFYILKCNVLFQCDK